MHRSEENGCNEIKPNQEQFRLEGSELIASSDSFNNARWMKSFKKYFTPSPSRRIPEIRDFTVQSRDDKSPAGGSNKC